VALNETILRTSAGESQRKVWPIRWVQVRLQTKS